MRRGAISCFAALILVSCAPKAVQPAPAPAAPSSSPPKTAMVPPESFREHAPAPRQKKAVPYPAAEHETLPNGLDLYLLRRPVGIVTISIVAGGGAEDLPPGKSGLSAFTARVMTEGTQSRSSLELAKAVEDLGASLEHDASRDFVHLGLTTLKEDFEEGASLLADVVRHPAFLQKEVKRVRGEWLDKLEQERQEPQRLASLAGFRLLYGPVRGAPVSGSPKDVASFTRADLVRYHRVHFTPKNCALVVAGDTDLSLLRRIASDHFSKWTGPAPKSIEPLAPRLPADSAKRVHWVNRPDSVQTAIFVGRPTPAYASPGFEARAVVNNAVGGLFTSRLNHNLRETHAYTYGVKSTVFATKDMGGFVVMTAVRTDATAEALGELFGELEALSSSRRPLTATELDRSRSDLVQQVGSNLEQTSDLLGDLHDIVRLGMPLDYFQRYEAVLQSLPPESIAQESARLNPNELIVVGVGDEKAAAGLAKAGFAVEAADGSLTE